ncbi:hypothetical protein L484_004105 [Morus notabilis]|uniref:Uncharacterized protein n=1 Tax=Morus notabilis TaxID=981085 RepID=W9R538_9ROSA|nr:hypothetical protein L484_004105 [Morus notabilis]
MTNHGWEDNYNNVELSFDTYPPENSSSIESLLRDAIATNDAILQSQETLLRSLENQDATAMLQQCKAEQQNEKSAINVLDSILIDEVNQYFTIEVGARGEVFESQPIVPPVMQEYMFEDPMWPPTPP